MPLSPSLHDATGTTLSESGVATGHLLRAKIYPESDDSNAPLGDGPDGVYERIEHTYNCPPAALDDLRCRFASFKPRGAAGQWQGEVVTTKDPNQTVHAYDRDKMGRFLHDCVLAFGSGIDDAVKRISTEYDPKRPGLVTKVSSHDDATPGQGNVLNEVGKAYDGFGQEIDDAQEHDGAVDGSTPKVGYGYENGSDNTARRTSITYPNGRKVNLGYGAADSIEDLFSLVKSVAIQGESGSKVEYTRAGLARFVEIAYPQPGVEMSMIRPGGGSEGDSGDPYDGYDRFSRVQEMRWQKSSGGTVLDGWQWGFNEASNRTWKKNLVAASGQDEAYGYDGVHQVIRDAVGTLNTNRTAIGGVPGEEEDFAYDPTGNWLGYVKSEEGSVILDQSRSNNKDNQLTQIDGSSALLAYDRAGNALKVPPGVGDDWDRCFQPVWDAWNRIVEVKDENGDTVQKNAYDGFFRRITKESGGVVTHTYWSDRWKPLEERIDSASTAARQYLWGERPGHRDELVLRDRDTDGNGSLDERLYATMDYFNGTVVLSASGVVQERYAYSAFGVRRVMAADFSARSNSLYDWDFGFQGQFRDAEAGWYNYGYRFYVPELGRWINRDPIGENGGVNLYGFAQNNGIRNVDILGLNPFLSGVHSYFRGLGRGIDQIGRHTGLMGDQEAERAATERDVAKKAFDKMAEDGFPDLPEECKCLLEDMTFDQVMNALGYLGGRFGAGIGTAYAAKVGGGIVGAEIGAQGGGAPGAIGGAILGTKIGAGVGVGLGLLAATGDALTSLEGAVDALRGMGLSESDIRNMSGADSSVLSNAVMNGILGDLCKELCKK